MSDGYQPNAIIGGSKMIEAMKKHIEEKFNMTTEKNDGGPAFPRIGQVTYQSGPIGGTTTESANWPGMSLRRWYAGMAMQGLIMNGSAYGGMSFEGRCQLAFKYADAMIAEWSK